jgi:ADP-heptose:LPS heptosyltransferase
MLAEQGMGDMIHFVRYAGDLAARGATVVVEAAPELMDLLRTVPGVAEIIPRDGPYHAARCDVQAPAMSLPYLLGTRPDNIVAPRRYVGADPSRVARWEGLLGARTRPRIGIAWAGNPEHARDRFRSIPLAQFTPLLQMRDYVWLALQKGPAFGQAASLAPGLALRDMGKHSQTFADLAALIELLDLVITVDTSVAHVAGALGRPALLLIDTGHDWRWPRAGADSRWYPSIRLVRQPARGDWPGAIREAVAEVRRFFNPRRSP